MDVLVVGGGIVGAAITAACARRGMQVALRERGALAGGASALDLALIPTDLDASTYLELHHFSGGAFFLDRSPPDEWPARRIDARAAAATLVAEARSYRADIRTGCEVKALLVRGGVVRGALTDGGDVFAGVTVIAAGAWSWQVCRSLGVHLPVCAAPGELVVTAPAPELEAPIVGDGTWVAQDGAGRLHVAHPDGAAGLLPGLAELEVLERRTLQAPATADGEPLAGPASGVDRLLLACGHGMYGVALAPAAAASVAEDARRILDG